MASPPDTVADRYAYTREDVQFRYQRRTRSVLRLLRDAGLLPLSKCRILDVGCGRGDWLADFEMWGARRADLAGIDQDPVRARAAHARFAALRDESGVVDAPGADIRQGDASMLPWPDQSIDLVVQSTLFTSVLDAATREQIAAEMMRVLRPNGAILWYDFTYDNPANRAVRGVSLPEIRHLFPGFHLRSTRITLAPPLARRIVPWSWHLAEALEGLRFLNTHVLVVLRRT